MRKLILIFALLSFSLGASAANKFNYCNDVSAPVDFLLQLKFSNIPNFIDSSNDVDDSDVEFEVYLSPDKEIDAVRIQTTNNEYLFVAKKGEHAEPQFPNLMKAINAQYENRAYQFPKPSYYHFLFRLYPF